MGGGQRSALLNGVQREWKGKCGVTLYMTKRISHEFVGAEEKEEEEEEEERC